MKIPVTGLQDIKKLLMNMKWLSGKNWFMREKYDCESGATGADYLLKQDVTAIFAFNDMSAYGAYNRMNQKRNKDSRRDFSDWL